MLLKASWFTGGLNARALALGRILCGSASAFFIVELTPVVTRMASGDVLRVPYALPAGVLTPTVGWMVLGLWTIGTLGMLLGLGARASCLTVCLAAGFVVLLDAQTYSNHMYLLAIMAGIFASSRCGEAFTVMRARAGATGGEADDGTGEESSGSATGTRTTIPDVPRLPAEMMVAVVGIVYIFAALAKVNTEFLSGVVVFTYMPGPIRAFLLDMPGGTTLLLSMSVAAVVLELALGVAFLLPRYRRDAFMVGAALHLGMITTVQTDVLLELIGFALLMFAAYVPALALLGISRDVVWDDKCSVCAEWVGSFRRLDWLGALNFHGNSDERQLERFSLTRAKADASIWTFGGHQAEHGFRAVIEIMEQLPLTFAWARVLRLPPIAALGERGYKWYARRR